ncbi:MAG TPA: plastocyanin/azurin family copper-binding protein [Vicinamibacterales bacterium]|nr:plastocyanin/azurin family copper-binding protein [Vicinamibacterales bacterium]
MYSRLLVAFSFSAALVAAGCSSSSSPATPTPSTPPSTATPPSTQTTSVSIPQGASLLTLTAFNPNPVTVSVGTTVRWTNTDSVAHTSTADGSAWNSGTLAAGAHFDFTFQATGTFPYHCAIHPGMVGSIVVR